MLAAALAVHPEPRGSREERPRAVEGLEQLRRDKHHPGRNRIDAMRERGADQVGVEERDRRADLGEAEPDRHVVRLVAHQKADGVPARETLIEGPSRVSIGAGRELPIGEGFACADQGRLCPAPLRNGLDDPQQRSARVRPDPGRAFQGAEPARRR